MYEYTALTEPLTVHLTPHSLCPTCVGDGEVETVGVNVLPESCGRIVTERVFVRMYRDLRITRCSRREVHKKRIVSTNIYSFELGTEHRQLFVEAMPALASLSDNDFRLDCRGFGKSKLDLLGNVTVGRGNNCGNSRGIEAVLKIVLYKLIGCGNGNRSELIEREH